MRYFEQKEIVKDICMSYGFKFGGFINFDRWQPDDVKTVRDFQELEHEEEIAHFYDD